MTKTEEDELAHWMQGKDTIEEIEPNEVVKCMHSLAIDLLKDKDDVYDIRKYFLNN